MLKSKQRRLTSPPPLQLAISRLKGVGAWEKLDAAWIFAQGDQRAARTNLKGAPAFDCTEVNSPTFTPYRGFAGNGSSSYLNTNWDPSNNGVNFVQDSAFWLVWLLTSRAAAASSTFAAYTSSANQLGLSPRWTGDLAYANVNNQSASLASTETLGCWMGDRSASTTLTISRNDTTLGSPTAATSAVTAQDIYVGASNSNGSADRFETAQIAAVMVGGNMGATLRSQIYAIMLTYMRAVGAVTT